MEKIKLIFQKVKALLRLKLNEINILNKVEKPVIINLNANDICNSKCTMCNIWKNKQGKEVTYNDLKVIFSDSLYSNVTGVGITGGEPTLREDLVELYKAGIDFLPNLKYLSIITNCINIKDA